jgi:hypothetical protein
LYEENTATLRHGLARSAESAHPGRIKKFYVAQVDQDKTSTGFNERGESPAEFWRGGYIEVASNRQMTSAEALCLLDGRVRLHCLINR